MSVLNTKVLVLNRSYFPVHITSVRRAFALLYQGLAKVVDQRSTAPSIMTVGVRSRLRCMRIPSV